MLKKIAIIGGGNAGLAAAIGLQQKGFKVQVFEKAKQFLPLGGDIGLWPNGLQILDKLGLYQQILQKSGRYPTIKLGNEQGELISEIPVEYYHQIAPYDPINICRYELQDILVNGLGEQNIYFNKQCVKIEESQKNVVAYFNDGTYVTADLLIGADGANSFVRNYVESSWQLDYAGYLSLGGINILPYDIKYNLIYGKYISGAFPLSDKRHIFFFVTQHEDCDLYKLYPSTSDQIDLFRNHSPLLDDMLYKLEESIESNNKLNYFFVKNYNLRPLSKWSKGRVVLAGDAAHLVGAILGCATSVVLEGIDTLMQCLEQYRQNHDLALLMYQKLHQPRSNNLLQLERLYTNNFMHESLASYLSFSDNLISCLKRSTPEYSI